MFIPGSPDQRISEAEVRPMPAAAMATLLAWPALSTRLPCHRATSPATLSRILQYISTRPSTLNVTSGTYVWSWGVGENQNFTLVIPRALPEPASAALLGMGCYRRDQR